MSKPAGGGSHTANMLGLFNALTDRERTRRANRQLGCVLAFVAGAINAGGFLAVNRYTSHMTGIISGIADDLVLGELALVLAAIAFLATFIGGAAVCAIMVSWARRRDMRGQFVLPLLLEAALLLLFGVLGPNLDKMVELFVPATVLLLCFIMGLQNAVLTKISHAEIRTTHMTGVVTDLGIELGRLAYWNQTKGEGTPIIRADRDRLAILGAILGFFLLGGIAGAAAFKAVGYVAVLPVAALLVAISLPPLLVDWRRRQ